MRRLRQISLVLLTLALPAPALAHGGGPRPMQGTLSDLPPGPIKRALLDVRDEAAKAEVDPKLVERPIDQALRAMERARNARAAGDVPHAAMLENLAAEWSKVAELLVRAAKNENEAKKAAGAAGDKGSKLDRARTLLSEQQARRGRLQAELADEQGRIERARDAAVEREKSRLDQAGKGKLKPKAPQRPAAPKAPEKAPKPKKTKGGK